MSPPESNVAPRRPGGPLDLGLAVVWVAAAAWGVVTFTHVFQGDFPAQPKSLTWIGGLVALALVMAVGPWVVDAMLERPDNPRLVKAVSVFRVVALVPWVLALLVAAAGFSA